MTDDKIMLAEIELLGNVVEAANYCNGMTICHEALDLILSSIEIQEAPAS